MRKISKKKKSNKVQVAILLFLLVVSVILILPSVVTNSTRKVSYGETNNSAIKFTPIPAHNSLQLQYFELPTPTPTVAPVTAVVANTPAPIPTTSAPQSFPGYPPANAPDCSFIDDQGVQEQSPPVCRCIDLEVECINGKPYTLTGGNFVIPVHDTPLNITPGQNPCGTYIAPGNGLYCIAKPVIYLYPTKQELVDVTVQTAGAIVVSDPHYPEGGWRHVLAQPNGSLTYNDKQYSELFYESSVNDFGRPNKGIVIPTGQLTEKLDSLLSQLGLVGNEKKEFLGYWLPRLQSLHSPYIFFSVIDKSSKANVDNVTISPKPDTQIAFIAYFKPIETSDNTSVLQLPPTPKRVGFTSVEWGGIIDK